MTGGQRVTEVDMGLQGDDMGLQRVTGGDKGLHEMTRGYRG